VEPLTIKQTATGYWVVQRGSVPLAGAMTRQAAEAERDLRDRLHNRSVRRVPHGGEAPSRPAHAPDRTPDGFPAS
jgi:hypothetical protein